MKSKKILIVSAILTAVILFTCACNKSGKTEVVSITDLAHDENGRIIVPGGYIGIAVYGKDKELIFGETFVHDDYKKNITVADLSKDVCRDLNIPFVFSGTGIMTYVQGINNLFEFDSGLQSGWLYSVNGEFQSVSCGNYILESGDYVEWFYTLDFGKDVGAYKLTE